MRQILLAGAILASVISASADVTIVRDGAPAAVIVLQPDASEQLAEAVGEMQTLIERSTGAALTIAEAAPEGMATIHIGRTPYGAGERVKRGYKGRRTNMALGALRGNSPAPQ